MARRRWDLGVFALLVVSPALAVLAVGATRQQTGPLERRLVAALTARAERTASRPLHRAPALPGAFGDGLAPRLASFVALQRTLAKDHASPRVDAVLEGAESFERLPTSWKAALDAGAADVAAVWAGTRASADLSDAREPLLSPEKADWHGLRLFTRLAGLTLMQRLAVQDAAGAIDACTDTLAVGRDAALLGGFAGLVEGLRVQRDMMGPCLIAIDVAAPAEKRRALEGLAKLREGMPSFGPALTEALVDLEMLAFGETIDPAELARLPERVRSWGVVSSNGVPKVLLRDAWAGTRECFDACLPLATLGHDERELALGVLERETRQKYVNPMVAVSLAEAKGLLGLADTLESGLANLDGLIIAGAADELCAREGHWPTSLEAIIHSGLTGRISPAEFTGHPTLAADGATLRVRVQGSSTQRDPGLLTFLVHQDPTPHPTRRSKP
jgi:hypothetical protein